MNNNTPSDPHNPEGLLADGEELDSGNEEFTREYFDDAIDYDVDPDSALDDDEGFSPQVIARPREEQSSAEAADTDTEWDDELEEDQDIELGWGDDSTATEDEDPELWSEDDEEFDEEIPDGGGFPLGLIAMAVIAVILLSVGGYGVMQQRSGMQEEIRQLHVALATAAQPDEVANTRESLRQLEQRNDGLRAGIATLQLENRRLQDTVEGLESQLAVQQEARAKQVAPKAQPKPAPKPAPKPEPKPELKQAAEPAPAPRPGAPAQQAAKPATKNTGEVNPASGWFVNFGSYSQREAAESWAARLHPANGTVIVAQGEKGGRTFYRVRVVGLADKAGAEEVSRQLEKDFDMPRLWVGRQ